MRMFMFNLISYQLVLLTDFCIHQNSSYAELSKIIDNISGLSSLIVDNENVKINSRFELRN